MANLTVGMTPSFFFDGDWLLRAQLKNLSVQEDKDFDVVLIDSHYQKRKDLVPQYAEYYKLNLIHVPYTPNLHVAKRLDCAIFNAPYMFSESSKIVRFSCWRFVRPNFTKLCNEATCTTDFYFHNCNPKNEADTHPLTNHSVSIWDMTNDVVNWQNIPKTNEPGCAWTHHSDQDESAQLMPANCYGNYMVPRALWLQLNGCNEVFTNNEHWEDQDFCLRARNLGVQCQRKSHVMYRLHHYYGSFAGRSNVPTDFSFKKPCAACDVAQQIPKPNRYDIKNRLSKGEIDVYENEKIWVCKTCYLASAVFYENESEATTNITNKKFIKSTILPKYKLGRNLTILAEDMDGKSLQEKVDIYKDSWTNERYYVK